MSSHFCRNHPDKHFDLTRDATHVTCIDCGDSWPLDSYSSQLTQFETRVPTAKDIAVIQGQIAECNGIRVAVLGEEYGYSEKLAERLARRSIFLHSLLEKAESGEPMTFEEGRVTFSSDE